MHHPRRRAPKWSYVLFVVCTAFLVWDFWKNPDFLLPVVAGVSVAVIAAGCGAVIGLGVIAYRHARSGASLVIAALLAITMYRAFGGFSVRRSANDAFVGVSFDSVPVIEFVAVSGLLCLAFFWQHRRQSGARRPAQRP